MDIELPGAIGSQRVGACCRKHARSVQTCVLAVTVSACALSFDCSLHGLICDVIYLVVSQMLGRICQNLSGKSWPACRRRQ